MRLHVLDLVLDQVRHGGVPLPEELLDLLVELELLRARGLVHLEEVARLVRLRLRLRLRPRLRLRVRVRVRVGSGSGMGLGRPSQG